MQALRALPSGPEGCPGKQARLWTDQWVAAWSAASEGASEHAARRRRLARLASRRRLAAHTGHVALKHVELRAVVAVQLHARLTIVPCQRPAPQRGCQLRADSGPGVATRRVLVDAGLGAAEIGLGCKGEGALLEGALLLVECPLYLAVVAVSAPDAADEASQEAEEHHEPATGARSEAPPLARRHPRRSRRRRRRRRRGHGDVGEWCQCKRASFHPSRTASGSKVASAAPQTASRGALLADCVL